MAKVNKSASISSPRPLCCRYALVLVSPFTVEVTVRDATERLRWRWAFGMLADGDCEALGAWPATASQDVLLREHLRERGVVRIGALLGDETLARVMGVPVAVLPLKECGIVAMARAARLHAKVERAVSRASPFANSDSASACVGRVLEEVELAELERQCRSRREPWRASRFQTPGPGAGVLRG